MTTANAVLESLRRIRRKNFAEAFYRRFFMTSPEAARLFRHTDFRNQQKMLEHGVLMLLEFASGSSIGRLAVERLAVKHDRAHVNVPPTMYSVWLDCLVATAAELDDDWTQALASRWKQDLAPGIDLMTSRYEDEEAT